MDVPPNAVATTTPPGPAVDTAGVTAVQLVVDEHVKLARSTPPSFVVSAVEAVLVRFESSRLYPVIVMLVPPETGPDVGEIEVMTGVTDPAR